MTEHLKNGWAEPGAHRQTGTIEEQPHPDFHWAQLAEALGGMPTSTAEQLAQAAVAMRTALEQATDRAETLARQLTGKPLQLFTVRPGPNGEDEVVPLPFALKLSTELVPYHP